MPDQDALLNKNSVIASLNSVALKGPVGATRRDFSKVIYKFRLMRCRNKWKQTLDPTMNELIPREAALPEDSGRRSRWPWLLGAGCLLVIFIALLLPREESSPSERADSTNAPRPGTAHSSDVRRTRAPSRRAGIAPTPTPEEVVAGKLSQFGRTRRNIVHALAQRSSVDVPADVERFFDAVEAGHWDELDALAKSLSDRRKTEPHPHELDPLWPAVLETWGVAQQAHEWPAQKLLDYGEAVLGSLRPGMVYVGGTDPGRFIPTLLNETSAGEHRIVLTQNAFADNTYLDYVNSLYDDRLATLTHEDSRHAFQDYLADAQKRLQHDQQFPNEPKQIRPGEDVRVTDGRVQVSGQIAVMAINERLLQALMEKNPDASFALEESFPLKSTYANAAPLGPIMELRAPDGQSAFTPEKAAQSLDYWRAATQQLLADAEAAGSPNTLKTWSHTAVAQANLFANRNFGAEAEQTYRLAGELWPGNPEAAGGLSELLTRTGRAEEARRLLDEFTRKYPDQRAAVEMVRGSISILVTTSPAPPAPPPPP